MTGMEKHSDEAKPQLKGSVKDFEDSMRHYMASFQTSQLLCAMNELSNHDHSRFMTRTNEKWDVQQHLARQLLRKELNRRCFVRQWLSR